MNEIDQILSNIDKDDDDKFFPEPGADTKRNEEISRLIETLDASNENNEITADSEQTEANDTDKSGAGHDDASVEVSGPEVHEESKVEEIAENGIFSVRGTKTWNRREPYIIPIDRNGYKNDILSLQKAFFFVEEPSDHNAIRQKIKQEIVAFLRRPTGHVTDRYTDFICKKIMLMLQELSGNFNLSKDIEKLFIYHIGPLTAYKYLKDDFYQNKYGYCYKYLPGNKAARFFPDDYIKEIVLKWYEENINTLGLPFDSIQKYEEMKKIVMRKYYSDLRTFNTRLDQLNAKLGVEKSISRIKLFQIKGIQWFGHLNVEVYRRFVGGTIFM